MDNFFETLNVSSEKQYENLIGKLNLTAPEMIKFQEILESYGYTKSEKQNLLLELMAGSADGNFAILENHFKKKNEPRRLKESVNMNTVLELNDLVDNVYSKCIDNKQAAQQLYQMINKSCGKNITDAFFIMVRNSPMAELKFDTDMIVDGKNVAQCIDSIKNDINNFLNSVEKPTEKEVNEAFNMDMVNQQINNWQNEYAKEKIKELEVAINNAKTTEEANKLASIKANLLTQLNKKKELIEDEELTIDNRIAGVYDINKNSFEELPKGGQHNLSLDDYKNGKVRYSIQDTSKYGKVCYITAIDKGYAYNSLRKIKNHYKNVDIDTFNLEFRTDDGKRMFIKLDSSGKQIFENKNVQNFTSEEIKEMMDKKVEEGWIINFNYSSILLTEGIEELQKYFPKMDLNKIKELVALDPTYKGGNELGKYGKWIIKLAYNKLKNENNMIQYNELLKKFPNGINPKTNQPFQAPAKLPEIQDEDLYKITDSLKKYDLYKKEIKKPLDSFKSLPELDAELSQIQNKGIPTNELALKRYNLFKKAEEKGLKQIYEDDKWIVGIPTTKESSCVFGSDTSWCTTSAGGKYYENYTEYGNLFINLNKQTGELFQFHFESEQFMDEHDKEVSLKKIVKTFSPQLKEIYKNNIKDKPNNLKFMMLFNNKPIDKSLTQQIKLMIDNDSVSFQYINNPTKEIIDYAIQKNPLNIRFLENPTKSQIKKLISFNIDYAPEVMKFLSDDEIMKLIDRYNYLLPMFYRKDESRFTPEFFKKIISGLSLNQILDVVINISLNEELFMVLFDTKFKSLNKDVEQNVYSLRVIYQNSKIDINKASDKLKNIILYLKPDELEKLSTIDESNIDILFKIADNPYDYGVRRSLTDIRLNDKIKELSPKLKKKFIKLFNIINLKNYFFPYDDWLKYFDINEIMNISNIMKTQNFDRIIDYVEDKYPEEFIPFLNKILSPDNYNGIQDRGVSVYIDFLKKVLPIRDELEQSVQTTIFDIILKMIEHDDYKTRVLRMMRAYYDNISLSHQKKILQISGIEAAPYINNLDERIQIKLVEKNPYNIKYINNPTPKVVKIAYEKNPDSKNYIR